MYAVERVSLLIPESEFSSSRAWINVSRLVRTPLIKVTSVICLSSSKSRIMDLVSRRFISAPLTP